MKTHSDKVLCSMNLKSKGEINVKSSVEYDDQKWSSLKKVAKVREQAIKFLWKACNKFSFKKDTLFLAIKIADTLIQDNFRPFLQDFQLVSASLVILTTKYNEVYPVTIDQISQMTEKFYPRRKYFQIEGSILECLNFEIPETTVYSKLYNEINQHLGGRVFGTECDKENNRASQNTLKKSSQKVMRLDEDSLAVKTLKAIQEPECFKYGEQMLVNAIFSYIKDQKIQGSSVDMKKMNYIRALLKKIFEPQKVTEERKTPSISKCVSPLDQKLNPEKKFLRKQQIFALC